MAGLGFHSQENWFVARLNESDSAGKPAICPKDPFKPHVAQTQCGDGGGEPLEGPVIV